MSLEDGYTPQPLVDRTRGAAAARGLRPVVGDLARWAGRAVAGVPWTVPGQHGSFELDGQRYPYLYHRYKRTWLTERAVEVPVVQSLVDRHHGARVLEVGNVLGHYRPQTHVVVDKYEPAPGVLNRDVFELEDLGSFDLIVAVSTLEHVGWDEDPHEPGRALEAVGALRRRLTPEGRLVVTVPMGYNPPFDAALRQGAVGLSSTAALRRTGGATSWRQVAVADVWSAPYDFLLYSARGVLLAVIERGRE